MKEEDHSTGKILSELLDPKNIDMKTHIQDPITFAMLEAVVKHINEFLSEVKVALQKFPLTKKVLMTFLRKLKQLLVSYLRLGRKEITETLKATKEEESGARSLFQRLAGLGRRP